MAVASKKDQPAAAPSLLARIDELHREIEDFIERKIDEIVTAEGPGVPRDSLRLSLTHGSQCRCAIFRAINGG